MEETKDVKLLKIVYFILYVFYEYILYSIGKGYIGESYVIFVYLFFLQTLFFIATYFMVKLLGHDSKVKVMLLLFTSLTISLYLYVVNSDVTHILTFSVILVIKSIYILIFYYIE